MKIVFFGTANVALPILEALKKEHEILAVVTNPDVKVGRKQTIQESPVSALATDLKLPIHKPDKVKNNSEFLATLKSLNADIFVVVAYGKILPLEIINLPPHKTINVHFSLLPKYRGPSPIQAALLNGDSHTGTSIFILDEQVDTGPLIAQEIVAVEPDDNYFTLSDKLAKLSAKIISGVVADYASGKITPLPQVDAGASHTNIISKNDGKVDWNKTSSDIYNQFRAFYLWPGIWTMWNGKKIKITDCMATELQVDQTTDTYRQGQVLEGGAVACGQNTFLKINSLQLEGKNESPILEFLNGYQNFVNSKLN